MLSSNNFKSRYIKYLIIIFYLFPGGFCLSQNSIDETTSWYMLRGDIWDSWYVKTRYTVVGDTILGDNTYYVIQADRSMLYMDGPFSVDTSYYSEASYYRFLREENNKFYSWQGENDYLIIDFQLEINDTLGVWGYGGYDVIVGIDSILIGDEFRKVYRTYEGNKIYEGIGTSTGLFEIEGWLGDEGIAIFKCYTHNGEVYELESDSWLQDELRMADCSDYLTSTKEINSIEEGIRIYPNPFFESIKIEVKSKGKYQIEVFSMSGQQIKYIELSLGKKELSLSDIPRGIYVIRIRNESKVFTEKFIKM